MWTHKDLRVWVIIQHYVLDCVAEIVPGTNLFPPTLPSPMTPPSPLQETWKGHLSALLTLLHSTCRPTLNQVYTQPPPRLSCFLPTQYQNQPRGDTRTGPRSQRGKKACAPHASIHLPGHRWDGMFRVPLLGSADTVRSALRGELCGHVSYSNVFLWRPWQPAIFSLALMKFPGLKSSSNILSTCTIRPYLSCCFPILSIRGSPRFKNGNESWLLHLHLLLASNHGNIVHTIHHEFSQRIHEARHCFQSAYL